MYTENVKYVNLRGEEKEKTLYFHISKAELIDMQMSEKEGFDKLLKNIIETQDTVKMYALFKTMILKSYGVVSEDGDSFIKDPVETMKFEKTEAYSEFLMSLVTDTDKAIAFTKAIMPNIEGMNEKIDAEMARIQKEKAAEIGDTQKQGE